MKSNYQVIIKTRPIICFSMSHTIYLRIQVRQGWLLETNEDRRTMFRMGPVHARDNDLGVSDTEPECTARYQILLYVRRT